MGFRNGGMGIFKCQLMETLASAESLSLRKGVAEPEAAPVERVGSALRPGRRRVHYG